MFSPKKRMQGEGSAVSASGLLHLYFITVSSLLSLLLKFHLVL